MNALGCYFNLVSGGGVYLGEAGSKTKEGSLEKIAEGINAYLDGVEPNIDNQFFSDQVTGQLKARIKKAEIHLKKAKAQSNQAFLSAYARLSHGLARSIHLSLDHLQETGNARQADIVLAKELYAKAVEFAPASEKYFVNYLEFTAHFDRVNFKRLFAEGKSRHPALADIHVVAAEYFTSMGGQNRAMEELTAAAVKNPNCERLYEFFGGIALEMGENETAVENFEKVIAINPNNIAALNTLAELYSKLGQPGKALSAYLKILDLLPENIEVQIKTGNLYLSQGDYDNAIKFFEAAVTRIPERGNEELIANIYSNMACAYNALYHSTKIEDYLRVAGKSLMQARLLAPRNSTINYNLACYWALKGDMKQADRFLRIAFRYVEEEEANDLIKTYREDDDLTEYRKSKLAPLFEEEVINPLLKEEEEEDVPSNIG